MSRQRVSDPPLHWEKDDFERRLCFAGAKYTGTNSVLTFLLGTIVATAFYVALLPFPQCYFAQMLLQRGPVPYAIVWLASWSLIILFVKRQKLKLQRQSLKQEILPREPDFVLSQITANDVLDTLYELADDPKRFLLLSRIGRALSNLRNIGRVSDVDEILRSQADNDESYTESTYTLIRGFIWAIPVLGFIGTVQGLSGAIGGFGSVLSEAGDIGSLRGALQNVTGGLSVAFETTLIALVTAVCIQLLLTALKRQEESFLDECSEYCHEHIVSKLRIIPVGEDLQVEGKP